MRLRPSQPFVNPIRIACMSMVVCLGWSAGALAQDPPPNFTGTWKLDRSLSEPMREMLKAQGYNAIEVGILEKVPVTQIVIQSRDGMSIEIRSTIVRTSEQLRFDGQSHPDRSNVLGPLVRLSEWSPDGRQLLTTTRYNAKCGLGAEMIVTRTIAGTERNRLMQETRVKLADGREFKSRQVFVRQESAITG
jgi:hypothetical protein